MIRDGNQLIHWGRIDCVLHSYTHTLGNQSVRKMYLAVGVEGHCLGLKSNIFTG